MAVSLMIIGALICSQGAAVCYKTFSKNSAENYNSVPPFMAFWTGILGIIATIMTVLFGGFNPSGITVITAIISGLAFAGAGILGIYIMATGPFFWSMLMVNLACFIPVLYAPVFLGEVITILQILGVLSILPILFIMNSGRKSDIKSITPRWMLLAVGAMLLNGIIFSTQKTQAHFTDGELRELISIMFMAASFFAGVYSLFIHKKGKHTPFKSCLKPAMGLVFCIGIYNVLSLTLMDRVTAAIQFPILVGGGIILSAIISVVLYKEHPTWRLYVSSALLIIGVILLGF